MIHVVYHREYNRVTVEGHAGRGEQGHDLICAAASILALTLASNVERIAGSGMAGEPVMILDEGKAEISCKPGSKYKYATAMVFDTVCEGFALLAADYPEYISYEIRGVMG